MNSLFKIKALHFILVKCLVSFVPAVTGLNNFKKVLSGQFTENFPKGLWDYQDVFGKCESSLCDRLLRSGFLL